MRGEFGAGGRVFWGYFILAVGIVLLSVIITGTLKFGTTLIPITFEQPIVPVVIDALCFYWGIRILSGAPLRRRPWL
jgi:hypothetical protein